MLTISNNFSASMDQVVSFMDIFSDLIGLAKTSSSSTTSRTNFVLMSKQLRRKVVAANRIDIVAYDGSFLHVCSEFELGIRALIDRYIEKAAASCPQFAHLPTSIKTWYPRGCAEVMLKLDQRKFEHLTSSTLVQSLASTTKNVSNDLVSEAFSFNDRNFSSGIIEDVFDRRLGIVKIWKAISRNAGMQNYLGTTNTDTVERLSKERLNQVIDRRNDLIHRGRAYYATSSSELTASIDFLRTLITSLAEIMEAKIMAL